MSQKVEECDKCDTVGVHQSPAEFGGTKYGQPGNFFGNNYNIFGAVGNFKGIQGIPT